MTTAIETPAMVAVNAPWAGLGNRIRFTLSAQAVAEAEGRHFYYSWHVGSHFGAALTDLWQYEAVRVPAEGMPADLTEADDLTSLRDRDLWCVRSGSAIRGDGTEREWSEIFASLQPVAELAERISRFRREFLPGPYVGVQIRVNEKTHAKTLAASPVSWFTTRMREMITDQPETRFFLSCDEPEVQSAILSEFPMTVALGDKGQYNTFEGIRSSVVDLHLLAGARHLLGPYWSSFVEMAWLHSGRQQALETSRSLRRAGSAQ
ncbi:hypothetical protein [Intrasporangium calvum]|uniref:Uncharacterized protein n=1 Tax=Intrasporangium calvum (strain ATCC 23552 / DSM 43043 / JCM 3097 / NBRC 12989 / NCIMB 10167 / NRRL B-3866 / 7 KIP) TaxID=710696 RepID=E6SE43_INTC7|nr:hypothetical protein [Intrasporangium calvum]ADU47656.1 hypothetical protein Intca_1137 [Intrasporangium calvum DSM 43043]